MTIYDEDFDDERAAEDDDDFDAEDDADDTDAEDDDAWPVFSRTIPVMTAVPVQATEPPADQVSVRFMVVCWVVIIPALLGILAGFWIGGSGGRHHSAAHPLPWSCASVLASGQGAAIYPLCNQWQADEKEVTP